MTRMVAIGAVIGFAATIIALSVWDRGSGSAVEPLVPDAGPVTAVNPKLLRAMQLGPPATDVKGVYSPEPRSLDVGDAGAP
ncbi:MAG: hypothetical protein SFW67_29035 [Myxococcaceae bacterium]|nr:hypothetical protein [Myxococcaceae bacterium]